MTEPAIPIDEAASHLAAGREALARRAWQEAFDELGAADAATTLSGADLEALSEAAFFAARSDVRLDAKERAHARYVAEGDPVRAAYVALDVAREHLLRHKVSIASAWARRAERLLEGLPESYAHGFLMLVRGELAREAGDIETAQTLAAAAVEIGRRTGHADLHATALGALAAIRIATGATKEGFELLEEAAIAAVNGELSLITAGITSCHMIAACRDLTDYRRASEWLEATDRWCKRQEVAGFPGICRVHRAEILALHGGWERAEQELRTATSELGAFGAIPPLADGLYAIGEIRRLRGDLEGAEEALRQAHALGRSPQPALALIRLETGRVGAAALAIDAALAESTWDQWARGRLLAAKVEIALTAGDVARARAAADELATIVADYPSPALEAGRHVAHGRVLLAEGDAPVAATEMRAAVRLWRDVGSPYDLARARAVLSRALRAMGDEDDADLELRAARDEFKRLGAGPDLRVADDELRDALERRSRPAEIHRTFMFTDIVGSTTLAGALGNEAWERLLAWHDTALGSLFVRHGGEVVNSTGDGFFVAFASAEAGIRCAIEVQRTLDEHRRTSGFAPPVRIGLHTSPAVRRGADYSGVGVHVAARVAALAGGGEIVASAATLAEAPGTAATEVAETHVKGVADPIGVATVNWS